MSAPAETMATIGASPSAAADSAVPHRAGRLDRLLGRLADRLNPILVKETRQALKSRQFAITFALLLVLTWGWTLLGVALVGPSIRYGTGGPLLLGGYYILLALPLMVIVPFHAFRSLAAEQEDRTYELLIITALTPRRVIAGKLGSAAVQMLVYLSAVTPCLAFTYLLRGIDVLTILFIAYYTILASMGFSLLALLVGTLTSERAWQVVLSVLLVAGLLLVFWGFCALTLDTLAWPGNLPFDEPEFWQANGAALTAYLSFFVLLFHAAAARITFASDNRSTRLRAVMLAQQVLFVGWTAWFWPNESCGGAPELFYGYFALLGFYWSIAGALMSGEAPELSARVRRGLPKSLLGRALLGWFTPGPGTGFVFALGNLAAGVLVGLAMLAAGAALAPSGLPHFNLDKAWTAAVFGTLLFFYVAAYLGLGRLLVRLVRRLARVGALLAFVLHVLMVWIACFVPLVIQLLIVEIRNEDWTWLQVFDPFWTLAYVSDGNIWGGGLRSDVPLLLLVVGGAAAVLAVANLPSIARELWRARVEKPRRVVEEERAESIARHGPPQPRRISPWDVEQPEWPGG